MSVIKTEMATNLLLIIYHFILLLLVGNTRGFQNWHTTGNGTYRYVASPRSFQNARDYCQKFGGDLAQLKTSEINDFVQTLIGNQSIWFGLTALAENCSYRWIDGSLLDNTFSAWNTTETCHQYKRCFQLEQGKWWQHNCSIPNSFVCERSDFQKVHKRAAEVFQWISNPFAPLADLRVLVIAPQHQDRIDCKHVIYHDRDALTQRIFSSVVSLSIFSSSVVHELELNPTSVYHHAGKLVCGISSEFDDDITSVTGFHVASNRESEPFSGRFTVMAYQETPAVLLFNKLRRMIGFRILILTWRFFRTGSDIGDILIPIGRETRHIISSTRKENQGTYVTRAYDFENRMFGFNGSAIRLIVPDCPEGRWGPPSCRGVCDPCYNGGICHDLSGSCICPPGFTGKNCLIACGEHRFGSECDIECGLGQGLNMSCEGSQICRPDPYGCNCLSGYGGFYCNETCPAGRYGVNCVQVCHCSQGSACDIFSGECPGDCEDGWSGPGCQVPEVCPDGFYGEHCGEVCHCPTASCDRQTGYCVDADGACAAGYITEPSRNTYCDVYVGCFDSCSNTCHCSEGTSDCNSVTGECFSGKCLSGWAGPNCQSQIGGAPITTEGTREPDLTWYGGIMPWVLFGVTLILLVVCVLFAMRYYRAYHRKTSSKPSATVASLQPTPAGLKASPDNTVHGNQTFSADGDTSNLTYQPLRPSPGNVYVDENQPFSAGAKDTPDPTYQPLFEGPKRSKILKNKNQGDEYEMPMKVSTKLETMISQTSGDQNEYEIPINPSEGVYQNSDVKIIC